jgi:hypothetical protein
MSKIKVGTKLIAFKDYFMDNGKKALIKNKEYTVIGMSDGNTMFSVKSELHNKHYFDICGSIGIIFKIKEENNDIPFFSFNKSDFEAPKHYDNTNGSLYKVANERGWNSYLFEVVKRIERAEKKGEFISDIKKSIHVLELYLQEQGVKFKNQIEPLNK